MVELPRLANLGAFEELLHLTIAPGHETDNTSNNDCATSVASARSRGRFGLQDMARKGILHR
jgi:hypothetical protein